jgi:hypothetical protein
MDGRRNNKGAIGNKGGRKPKAEEDKAITRIKQAIKLIYKEQDDEDNIILFLKDFAETKEGMKFLSEHLLGKPAQTINANIGTQKTDLDRIFPDVENI